MRGRPALIAFSFFLPVFLIAQEPRQSVPGAQPDTRTAIPETQPQLTPSESRSTPSTILLPIYESQSRAAGAQLCAFDLLFGISVSRE
jgi:hypothetical protein